MYLKIQLQINIRTKSGKLLTSINKTNYSAIILVVANTEQM